MTAYGLSAVSNFSFFSSSSLFFLMAGARAVHLFQRTKVIIAPELCDSMRRSCHSEAMALRRWEMADFASLHPPDGG